MAGYIRVGNGKGNSDSRPDADEVGVWVDRTNKALGNTFYLRDANDPKERDKVCDQYDAKLLAEMESGGPMRDAVEALAKRVFEGENIVALCHCAPRRCHAESVVRETTKLVREMEADAEASAGPSERKPAGPR